MLAVQGHIERPVGDANDLLAGWADRITKLCHRWEHTRNLNDGLRFCAGSCWPTAVASSGDVSRMIIAELRERGKGRATAAASWGPRSLTWTSAGVPRGQLRA